MNTEFKAGDLVEVINAEGAYALTLGDVREVSEYRNGYVFLTSPTGQTGGWGSNRFKLIEPKAKPKRFVVGTIVNDKLQLLNHGKVYETMDDADEAAKRRVSASTETVVLSLEGVKRFASQVRVEIAEVSYEG